MKFLVVALLLVCVYFGFRLYKLQKAADVERINIFSAAMFILSFLAFFYLLPSLFPDVAEPEYADTLGQFGDYVGGLLNPIFGFASFLMVLKTLRHQAHQATQEHNENIKMQELTQKQLKLNLDEAARVQISDKIPEVVAELDKLIQEPIPAMGSSFNQAISNLHLMSFGGMQFYKNYKTDEWEELSKGFVSLIEATGSDHGDLHLKRNLERVIKELNILNQLTVDFFRVSHQAVINQLALEFTQDWNIKIYNCGLITHIKMREMNENLCAQLSNALSRKRELYGIY